MANLAPIGNVGLRKMAVTSVSGKHWASRLFVLNPVASEEWFKKESNSPEIVKIAS